MLLLPYRPFIKNNWPKYICICYIECNAQVLGSQSLLHSCEPKMLIPWFGVGGRKLHNGVPSISAHPCSHSTVSLQSCQNPFLKSPTYMLAPDPSWPVSGIRMDLKYYPFIYIYIYIYIVGIVFDIVLTSTIHDILHILRLLQNKQCQENTSGWPTDLTLMPKSVSKKKVC